MDRPTRYRPVVVSTAEPDTAGSYYRAVDIEPFLEELSKLRERAERPSACYDVCREEMRKAGVTGWSGPAAHDWLKERFVELAELREERDTRAVAETVNHSFESAGRIAQAMRERDPGPADESLEAWVRNKLALARQIDKVREIAAKHGMPAHTLFGEWVDARLVELEKAETNQALLSQEVKRHEARQAALQQKIEEVGRFLSSISTEIALKVRTEGL